MFKLFCLITVLTLTLAAQNFAQTPAKVGTATLTGRVSLKGEPVPGVTVGLQPQIQSGPIDPSKVQRAKTDGDGRFRFTGLVAGQYVVGAQSPGFISPTDQSYGLLGKTINLADGENVENVELALKRGGVITGRVTEANGAPVIENLVQLTKLDERGKPAPMPNSVNQEMYRTDDRGIYRLYGLPAGKYKLSVGYAQREGAFTIQMSHSYYARTFHPDTTDETQAKVITLEEGAEVSDVDIKIGEAKKTYDVLGRVVDAETGRPMPGLSISYGSFMKNGSLGGWGSNGTMSDAQGEFQITSVLPGKYGAFIEPRNTQSELYSELASFEVIDGDISGIEIKAQRGGSISGVAVIEGATDPAVTAKLAQISLSFYPRTSQGAYVPAQPGRVQPNGSFRITGMRPGKMTPTFYPRLPGIALLRIEHNDAVISEGLEIHAGEQLTGVRIVFGYGTATLRGQVKVIGGTLPEGTSVYVTAKLTSSRDMYPIAGQVDARGQFVIKDLAAGEYSLSAAPRIVVSQGGTEIIRLREAFNKATQTVTVSNGGEATVTITIDLSQKENER